MFFLLNAYRAKSVDCFVITGTTVSLIIKPKKAINIANTKIDFAILFMLIPQARMTVISEFKLKLLSVITVANNTPIGIVITNTEGRWRIIIKNAILNGIPYIDICLINVIKVSEAKIIDVKTKTPIINISITCFKIYLSSSPICFNLKIIFFINLLNLFKIYPRKYYIIKILIWQCLQKIRKFCIGKRRFFLL